MAKALTIIGIIIPVAAMGGLFAYAYPVLSTTWYSYVEPSEDLSKIEVSPITYHDLGNQSFSRNDNKRASPSTGELNFLCIPVEFTDYPFSETTLNDLNSVFNGSSGENAYWESVSSFYEKSSFGKLKINVEIASIYETGQTAEEFAASNSPTSITSLLARRAVTNYFSVKNKDPDFDADILDADDNGYIDGLYLIYSCPDTSSGLLLEEKYSSISSTKKEYMENLYWAYTAWNITPITGTGVAIPKTPNPYVWASYDFMYKAVSSPQVDGHTYIHETGHLLGLPDYYNLVAEEDASFYGDYAHYSPCGGLQMMDHNIGDMDAWTKFSLGWSAAYIVDKDKPFPQTFELEDVTLAGDLLLIPANEDDSYDDIQDYNAFGEYIALELYTPNGLNSLDSKATNGRRGYLGSYPTMYDITGVRVSHIDSRLAIGTSYESPTIANVKAASETNCYKVLANNYLPDSNPAIANSGKVYWFNQLLESNGEETLVTETSFADNETLFKGNNKKGDFSMEKFSSFFANRDDSEKPLFNNGKKFGYTFRINGEKTLEGTSRVSITVDKED